MDRTKLHRLTGMVAIALCAAICSAEGWADVERCCKMKQAWFGKFLEPPNGILSHDTFGRVFAMLDTTEFYAWGIRSRAHWWPATALARTGGMLIGDVPSASAILDRLLETAEIIIFQGRSYRLRNRAADAPSKPSKVLTGKTRAKPAGTSGTSATT